MKEKYKREMEKGMYRRSVLESFLVVATEDGLRLPTIKEFILSEVVNGTIEFVGGAAGQVNYQMFKPGGTSFEIVRGFYDYYEREIVKSKGKLNPNIRKAINEMVRWYVVDPDGPDRPYPNTELYFHFDYGKSMGTGICQVTMRSTFSLPSDLVSMVNKEVLPSFLSAERKSIEGIGKCMRRFIEEDLEYIKEHYYW